MKKIFSFLICFVFVSSIAHAVEITNPFHIPAKGDIKSTSLLSYQRTRTKEEALGNNFRTYNKDFGTRFEYGVSSKVAVVANVSNQWQRKRSDAGAISKEYNNLFWAVGAMYDLYNKDNAHFQAQMFYLQRETHHFGGAYKAFRANAKAGYDLEYFLPYVGGQIELPIAQGKNADNDLKYDSFVGLYKDFSDTVATDMTLHYNYNDYTKVKCVNGRFDLSFFITQNVVLGGFFDYSFYNHGKNHARTNENTVGAVFKFQF